MALQARSLAVASVPKMGGDYARFIASRQQVEGFTLYGPWSEEEHPSTVLRDRSEAGHRLGELYDVMFGANATLAGLWEKRWKAVVGLPWSIVPADESAEAKRIADLATLAVYGIPTFDQNLAHQLEAIPKGIAFDELRWERRSTGPLAGLWTPVECVDRPMWRFGFQRDAMGNAILCVRTKDGGLAPVPPGRILAMRHGSKDSPWGKPLLDQVYWAYWLALHAWKYYGVALEKWAAPTIGVSYNGSPDKAENEEQVSRALAIAAAVQTEYAFALPAGIEVKLLEATRGGSVSYEQFLALIAREMALVLLGEVDTSGLAKGPGSFAKSRVSNDVRFETIAIDATELATHLTDNLLAVFTRVNFGPDAPVPYWEFETEEAEDRVQRQAGMAAVLEQGLPVARSAFYRTHQCQEPKPGEPVVTAKGQGAPQGPFPPAKPVNDDKPDDEDEEAVDEDDEAAAWASRELLRA